MNIKLGLVTFLMLITTGVQAATITFDSPPFIGGGRMETEYLENGVAFTGLFAHNSTQIPGSASNTSSGLIELLYGGGMRIEMANSGLFTLESVDLSEYSYRFIQPTTVTFTGYHTDGSSNTQSFVTDGIFDSIGGVNDFETFFFSSAFHELTYVDIDSVVFAMDNLSIRAVPVPAAGFLFFSGLFGMLGFVKRRR
jgi:hypothetical protein